MKVDTTITTAKGKRILYSFLSIIVALSLIYIVYFNNKPDQKFGVATVFLLLRYFALWSGLLILLCRLVFLIKRNDSIIYIIAGMLNIILGIIAVIVFISNNMVMQILHLFLINLLLGVIIISDYLFLKKMF